MSQALQERRPEVGLSHVALSVRDIEASVAFYARYAHMREVHRRNPHGKPIVWLSDLSRPFAIVLIEVDEVDGRLEGIAHLGIGCGSRGEVDELCEPAKSETRLLRGPEDAGHPVVDWALLRNPARPDRHASHRPHSGNVIAPSRAGP